MRESMIQQTFGALLPGKRDQLIIVDRRQRPELLQSLAIDSGVTTFLARLPSPNLIFEEGEGMAQAVAYSAAYRSIIISFSGVFRVANKMTYVRALDRNGVEQWRIAGQLPSRQNTMFVGDFAQLAIFASGRYALLAKESARNSCEIIDLKDGNTLSTVRGWPLAVSRDSSIALVREGNGTLSLIQLRPMSGNRD